MTSAYSDYDPRDYGALCDRCPLNGATPVPPLWVANPLFTVVGEAPDKLSVAKEIPFAGKPGSEFDYALQLAGVNPATCCNRTYAVICKPDGGKMRPYLSTVRRKNEERVRRNLEPFLLPTEACRPRLLREAHQAKALLLLGSIARASILEGGSGSEESLKNDRGYPDTVQLDALDEFPARSLPELSTIRPEFVLHFRKWTPIFRGDIAKMVRMACGKLEWVAPEKVFFPKPDILRNILGEMDRSGLLVASDLETDSKGSPTRTRMRCIGFGTEKLATCVPVRSITGETAVEIGYYTPAEWIEIQNIMHEWHGDKTKVFTGHNYGIYDLAVWEHDGQVQFPGIQVKRRLFDTIAGHHVRWSEHEHRLGFVMAQYSDSPLLKVKDPVNGWTSDHQLHNYCMDDCGSGSLIGKKLVNDPIVQGQATAYKADMFLMTFCRKLHEIGLKVDIFEREKYARHWNWKRSPIGGKRVS